jgi:hypothetical protein
MGIISMDGDFFSLLKRYIYICALDNYFELIVYDRIYWGKQYLRIDKRDSFKSKRDHFHQNYLAK